MPVRKGNTRLWGAGRWVVVVGGPGRRGEGARRRHEVCVASAAEVAALHGLALHERLRQGLEVRVVLRR